jgi:hypothetical protein
LGLIEEGLVLLLIQEDWLFLGDSGAFDGGGDVGLVMTLLQLPSLASSETFLMTEFCVSQVRQ